MSNDPVAIVVGVDPGKQTGAAAFAVYKSDDAAILTAACAETHDVIRGYGMRKLAVMDVDYEGVKKGLHAFLDIADEMRQIHAPDSVITVHVACEDFIITRVSMFGQAKWSLKIIGMLEYMVAREFTDHYRLSTIQKSADAKSLVTDKVIKEFGFDLGRRSNHIYDAVRHAILYTSKMKMGLVRP